MGEKKIHTGKRTVTLFNAHHTFQISCCIDLQSVHADVYDGDPSVYFWYIKKYMLKTQ